MFRQPLKRLYCPAAVLSGPPPPSLTPQLFSFELCIFTEGTSVPKLMLVAACIAVPFLATVAVLGGVGHPTYGVPRRSGEDIRRGEYGRPIWIPRDAYFCDLDDGPPMPAVAATQSGKGRARSPEVRGGRWTGCREVPFPGVIYARGPPGPGTREGQGHLHSSS